MLCQKQISGEGDGRSTLQGIVKSLSFAKQRFESMAEPQRQFCCLLVPIALLLAHTVSDWRQPSHIRSRAQARLLEMPGHLLTAVLSACYSEAAVMFIRDFDCAQHDPAKTYAQREAFLEKMRVFFLEGRVFDDSDDIVGTSLEIALRSARGARPIVYGDGQALHLWRRPTVLGLRVHPGHSAVDDAQGRC